MGNANHKNIRSFATVNKTLITQPFSNMTHFYKAALLALALTVGTGAYAAQPKKSGSIRAIKAVKSTEALNLLDRVESDRYRREYQYNEYGYITSMKVYNNPGDGWELDTDQSYEQTYTFDASGQCTERVRYQLQANGQRGKIDDRVTLEKEGGYTWERSYSTTPNGKGTYLSYALGYDSYGNLCIEIEYMYDEDQQKAYACDYRERHYCGKLPDENLYEYNRYYSAYCTYDVKAHSYGNEELTVTDGWKIADETVNGVLTRKEYYAQSGHYKLSDIDNQWELTMTKQYTLNADGTRPVAYKVGNEVRDTWEWDHLNRLVKHVDKVKHSSYPGGTTYCDSYTYADDYAAQLSLYDVIGDVGGLYPEQSACIYGHAATYHSQSMYGYEDQVAEYDANGRLKKVTYTEVTYPEDGGASSEPDIERGYCLFGYRADGHLAYQIDACPDEDSYSKDEYVYNSRGVWTGINEYEGKSENGPWELTYASGKRARRHAPLRHMARQQRIGEDMSEGYHEIEENDGTWKRNGYYEVEEGQIVYGRYEERPVNTASVPQDPDLNYTDPLMPLEGVQDSYNDTEEIPYIYSWDSSSNKWMLEYAPAYTHRTYQDGNQIKRDRYDHDLNKVRTEVFSFDSEKRLVKHEWNNLDRNATGYFEYSYLDDGSNYLSQRYEQNERYTETRRYYYSRHSYSDPTGIDEIKAGTKADPYYYDLQGRRVERPSHGIYIHQGRKVVVR